MDYLLRELAVFLTCSVYVQRKVPEKFGKIKPVRDIIVNE